MAAPSAGLFWRAARPSELAYRHTRTHPGRRPASLYSWKLAGVSEGLEGVVPSRFDYTGGLGSLFSLYRGDGVEGRVQEQHLLEPRRTKLPERQRQAPRRVVRVVAPLVR
jgi:hypothetical protein